MGHTETVKVLLEGGASLTARDKRGETPLQHARERNHTEIVQILEAAGARE